MWFQVKILPSSYLKTVTKRKPSQNNQFSAKLSRWLLGFLGWSALLIALTLSVVIAWPVVTTVAQFQFNQAKTVSLAKMRQFLRLPVELKTQRALPNQGGVSFAPQEFRLQINKINLDTRVIPNIEAGNKDSYGPALRQGVAHAEGSAFPGEGKLVYVFGHSTNYEWFVTELNALFYRLKDLEPGDEVKLSQGDKQLTYHVIGTKIIEADETTFIRENLERNILVLQTCFPPGTTWKRLIVIAEPVI